jgi:formylmethanofuran dehydrogenase subunit A
MAYRKGHLGIGADGDVTVYSMDPSKIDTKDFVALVKAFARPEYTIKSGDIVAMNGEVVAVPEGSRFYCHPHVDEDLETDMLSDVKEWFKYYTLGFANYPVPDKYLRNPVPIEVNRPLAALERR